MEEPGRGDSTQASPGSKRQRPDAANTGRPVRVGGMQRQRTMDHGASGCQWTVHGLGLIYMIGHQGRGIIGKEWAMRQDSLVPFKRDILHTAVLGIDIVEGHPKDNAIVTTALSMKSCVLMPGAPNPPMCFFV